MFCRSGIKEKSDAYRMIPFAYLFLQSYAVKESVKILRSEGLKYIE